MKAALFFLLLFPFFTLSGTPAQKDYARVYDDCLREVGITNNGTVGACSEGASNEAKTEINALYKRLYEKLEAESPEDAAKLEKAQKSWLTYRNLHCGLAASYVGSPMYTVCPMHLNIQRVKELRVLVGE